MPDDRLCDCLMVDYVTDIHTLYVFGGCLSVGVLVCRGACALFVCGGVSVRVCVCVCLCVCVCARARARVEGQILKEKIKTHPC